MIDRYLDKLKQQFDIIQVIDLDQWHQLPFYEQKGWLRNQLLAVYQPEYQNNQRIVLTLTQGDVYPTVDSPVGEIVRNLFYHLDKIDISNFFIILLSNDQKYIPSAVKWAQQNLSRDPISITCITCSNDIESKTLVPKMKFDYNSINPIKISVDQLNDQQRHLLTTSKTFCIYPWIHLHAYPTGHAYVCCVSDMNHPVGNCREKTLEQIWNDEPMKDVRHRMLNDQPVDACVRCYEQEQAGFLSSRQSANKHHGHNIHLVDGTQDNGHTDKFELTYWDIRFSNLCNLSCRSCGHIFSSSWYQDQVKLAGPEWRDKNKVLNYAGRTETDMWEQLVPHLDYVEQIYFAGGEPLMMEEHYNILDELERRGRWDVRLIYNTNFTQIKLKDRTVFDYWKKFKQVAVGASLDAMGARAEYIRKGTNWDTVERNRRMMQEICPQVDFYISPTLSIMNAMHLPDFHRDWVEKGLIQAQDLNVNILQDPPHFRIDIAPDEYKQQIKAKFEQHLEWLRPLDHLKRATVGFESSIKFMSSIDNTVLLDKFWARTNQLDEIRRENILDVIPELKALKR